MRRAYLVVSVLVVGSVLLLGVICNIPEGLGFTKKPEEEKKIDVRAEAQHALVLLGEAKLDELDAEYLVSLEHDLGYASEKTRAAILEELARRFSDEAYPREQIVQRLQMWEYGPTTAVRLVVARALLHRSDASLPDLALVCSILHYPPKEESIEARTILNERVRAASTKEEILALLELKSVREEVADIIATALVDRADVSAEDLIRLAQHRHLSKQRQVLFGGLNQRTAELRQLAETE